ncbi:NUDIX hydrolase [Georgenia sp. Z1491]|uniref:NUDIX hydrolase n=1 Tax=Georgenia sp. Z1491 TaxID=3416707 RepID=UPI003CF93DC4
MDIRVSSYVVLERPGEILLCRGRESAGSYGWTMPGGGLDPGEHPDDAAVREAREETGYEVELGRVLGVSSIVVPGAERLAAGREGIPLQGIRIVYAARIVGGTLRHEAEGTTDAAEWVRLDRVVDLDRVELVDEALVLAGL